MDLERKTPSEEGIRLQAESSTEGPRANKHGNRIADYGRRKKRSREMARFLANYPEYDRERIAMNWCASYLVFHNYYTIDEVRLAKITTCQKTMLCPFCAARRGARQTQSYLEKFKEIRKENPDLVPALLTLTVKNGDDLQERYEHLKKSFMKYQEKRRDYFKKGVGFNELCKAKGAVFSYETTYSEENGWHPHIHAIVLLDSYIDQKKMSQEWKKITKDSEVIDIRKIQGDSEAEITKGFAEVFKYSLKFSDLTLEQNLHAFEVMRRKRLTGSFGLFWGVKVPEKMTDDLIEDLPYLEMFYKFIPKKGAYDLTDCIHVYSPPETDIKKIIKDSNYSKLDVDLVDIKNIAKINAIRFPPIKKPENRPDG